MRRTHARILGSASVAALAVAGFAAPAFAQDASTAATARCANLAAGAERDACLTGHAPVQLAQADAPVQLAQASAPADAAQPADSSIVVTGSRIRRPTLESSVPITSVGPVELTERGNVSLGDALNELPSLRTTFSQANSTQFIGTAGLNELDLRGQGTSRTLVLVNGRRHVSAVPGAYIVDVNTIPSDLLERVDIVTGGNSAIYGSDAIAGVVNFVLRRNYEGIRMHAQGGVSTYGDRGSYTASIVAGHNFLDGRLNVAVAAEWAKSNTLFFADRPYTGALNGDGHGGIPGFITVEPTTALNRNFDGIPNTAFVNGNPGITFGNISLGGYIAPVCPAANATNTAQRALICTGRLNVTGTSGTAYNFAFLPDGTLARDDEAHGLVDNRGVGGGFLGGLSATGVEDSMLDPGLTRYSVNLLMNGNFSPAFQPFLEAKYVHVIANQQSTQPTFATGGLNATFRLDNPFLTPQAVSTLQTILNTTNPAATFTAFRFNNDLGTRSENHVRETWRAVIGAAGDISTRGNLHYEVSFNYGRTETYYDTSLGGHKGNVDVAHYNNATNAVRNAAGQIVCAINADATTANDDPRCVPINTFGYGAPSAAAIDYVTVVSSRTQWAEELNAVAFISGDSTGFFELPGGPVGFVLGTEYRREDAYSDYDDYTQAGNTFLNAFATFAPPAVSIKEAFGELRIPLLRDQPFFNELTLEGAARYSDYGGATGGVWAYNFGGIWAPVHDLRFRGSYARSVRAPNLSNLYATPSQTFLNAYTDPCDQPGGFTTNATNNISAGPNRARNCAAAGVPTTITYFDPGAPGGGAVVTRPWSNVAGAGIVGNQQGNINLHPEVGTSLTFGAVFQPRWIPGLSLTVDYYRLKITNLIASLTAQSIVNACYDDPGGIDNPFCAVVFRRTGTGDPLQDYTLSGQSSRRFTGSAKPELAIPVLGPGFLQVPFNFAAQKTSGIDFDLAYRTRINSNISLSLRAIVSWVENREQFASITVPTQSTRILGLLGDPQWLGSLSANLDFGKWDVTWSGRYIGRQIVSGLSYETFFPWQGRTPTNPDARPFVWYPPMVIQNFRINFKPDSQFQFYLGVDNFTNELPPYDLFGNENPASGVSGAIYPNIGRFFYGGVTVRFR